MIEGRPSTRISVALKSAGGETNAHEGERAEQELPTQPDPGVIVNEAVTTHIVISAADRDVEATDEQRVRLADRDERERHRRQARGCLRLYSVRNASCGTPV